MACNARVHLGAAHGKPDPPMSMAAMKYLLVRPKVPAPLDPNFCPFILSKNQYNKMVEGSPDTLEWACPRSDGCGRGKLTVLADGHTDVDASVHLAGVLIQEMIWQRSASELILCGPPGICAALQKSFSTGGKYDFEVKTMPKVCGTPDQPFPVRVVASAAELPASKDTRQVCGKDASGCRLAYDLGKSDIKCVAVKDNEVIDSQETEWDVTNPDPDYHFEAVVAALKKIAAKLPKVDAIGGSATGIVSGNSEAVWCDLFPSVPPDVYKEKVVNFHHRIAGAFGNVPFKVINDGEVTALAGKLMVGKGNLCGISMGSSEGGGYCDAEGRLMGWVNELAYVQLDLNPEAGTDPWSPHSGGSHMYLGQRAATRMAEVGGVDLPDDMKVNHPNMCQMKHDPHAQCLKLVQAAMKDAAKEPQVRLIYETIGVYLGYALAQYSEFYAIDNALVLGRVSTGTGGQIMLDKAKEVLMTEFPHLGHIVFHQPDEHFKRVGQCIAAAALPEL